MSVLLSLQDFGGLPVRVYGTPEVPLFVAADICRILELSNPTEALRSLEDDEKLTLSNAEGQSGKGGAQFFNAITESGLYALIFKSRKPEAKAFRKWVTKEVLPAIRKTGAFSLHEHEPSAAESAAWDLESVFDQSRQAIELLLAGRLPVNTAAAVASLVQECRKVYELRFRVAPPALAAGKYDPASEMESLLVETANRLEGDTKLRLGELVAVAREHGFCKDAMEGGEASPAGAKMFGRRLQMWRGRTLHDARGRAFQLLHQRTKHGVVYVFKFRSTEVPKS